MSIWFVLRRRMITDTGNISDTKDPSAYQPTNIQRYSQVQLFNENIAMCSTHLLLREH